MSSCAFDSARAYLPCCSSVEFDGFPLTVFIVGLHTALPTGEHMTWFKQFFCHGEDTQMGRLVRISSMFLGPLYEQFLLMICAACQVLAVTYMLLPSQLHPKICRTYCTPVESLSARGCRWTSQ